MGCWHSKFCYKIFPEAIITGATGDWFHLENKSFSYGVTAGPCLEWKWLGENDVKEGLDKGGEQEFPVPMAAGALQCMTKQHFFRNLGGYDEGMRIYGWEDVEFAIRNGELGYPVIMNPKLHFYHRFADTSKGIGGASSTGDQWSYNLYRTIYMCFEGQTQEFLKKCASQKYGMEPYQKAVQELEHDQAFQRRMNGFKAVRKLTGDQWLRKVKIDLVGQTVMARRAFRI
jgi:hypothetical protein